MKIYIRENMQQEYTETTMTELSKIIDNRWDGAYMVDCIMNGAMYLTWNN